MKLLLLARQLGISEIIFSFIINLLIKNFAMQTFQKLIFNETVDIYQTNLDHYILNFTLKIRFFENDVNRNDTNTRDDRVLSFMKIDLFFYR